MGVALRDILIDYKCPTEWGELGGVAAIDGNNALYQFLSSIRQPDGTPLMDQEGRITSHLSGLFFRSVSFIEKGIRPVYVFDGKPPALKAETLRGRREVRETAGERWKEALKAGDTEEAFKQARSSSRVNAETVAGSKRLLHLMGIPTIDAPSEGEAQAAVMAARGEVSYAVSQDYDSLLFGAPLLVRNLTVSGKRKIRGRSVTVRPERIVLSDLLTGLSISREDLIMMGILIGTDFNPGIRGIGPKTALKIVRQGRFDETLSEKSPDFDPEPIMEFFLHPPAVPAGDLSWTSPDTDGISAMLCGEYGFSETRVNAALERMSEHAGQKTLDQWF